jgi:hypothetical protein
VGTIILMDLRLLGRLNVEHGQLARWTRFGFAVMLTTGPLMFVSDMPRYLANPAFRLKMAFLAAALISHFTIHRKAVRAGSGRFAAILSMALWTCVVLGGRAIADFDL